MSAYMVSKATIDAIVATALCGPEGARRHWSMPYFGEFRLSFERANELGEALTKENLSSIHARYPDCIENPDATPGPIEQYWLSEYQFKHPAHKYSAVEMYKIIDCYEYQSCEHPEWEKSEAREFCYTMRKYLADFLPGYEAAPWGIE